LANEIPEALELACRLALLVRDGFQLPAGYFVTRTYLGGLRHTLPFMRWPQAQMFLAMTTLLKTVL
jgi:hypothetical protein